MNGANAPRRGVIEFNAARPASCEAGLVRKEVNQEQRIRSRDFGRGAQARRAQFLGDDFPTVQHRHFLHVDIPAPACRLFGPRAIVTELRASTAIITSHCHILQLSRHPQTVRLSSCQVIYNP